MISVIIPLYNQARSLSATLETLLAQVFNDFEVIIVNDGSTDQGEVAANSWEKKFRERGHDFKFMGQDHNQGAPAARNAGFRASRGEYLFFCDADAGLEPDALGELVRALDENRGASYAYSSFLWGRKLFRIGKWSAEKLKNGPCIHTMALIRREHFPASGWDESLKKLQDWDLWLTMLENGRKGVWVEKVLYKIKPGGTMSEWLPSIAYRLLPFLSAVKKYKKALLLVKKKHGLE